MSNSKSFDILPEDVVKVKELITLIKETVVVASDDKFPHILKTPVGDFEVEEKIELIFSSTNDPSFYDEKITSENLATCKMVAINGEKFYRNTPAFTLKRNVDSINISKKTIGAEFELSYWYKCGENLFGDSIINEDTIEINFSKHSDALAFKECLEKALGIKDA